MRFALCPMMACTIVAKKLHWPFDSQVLQEGQAGSLDGHGRRVVVALKFTLLQKIHQGKTWPDRRSPGWTPKMFENSKQRVALFLP